MNLLTVEEVAELLRVPPSWVREHSCGKRRPTLPSIKVGHYRRFKRDDIDRWLAQNMTPGECRDAVA